MGVLKIIWEIFFCSFSSLFQIFFCVKRPNSVTGCLDGVPRCLDGDSGCSDDMVVSSGHPCSLFGWACLCDLLRGTTSERHLSFVRTVNPVGLNCILLGAAHHFLFVLFVILCFFLVIFMRISHMHVSSLQFTSSPGMFVYLFTVLF
jgi:hypothetical protein